MERTTRLLYGMAAILLLLGLALRIAPASVGDRPGPSVPGSQSGLGARKTTPATAGADAAIVGGNIFSVTRSPPRIRYTPSDLASPREPARARPRPKATGLRLVGTVSGTAALIDVDPAVRGAEIYQIGDVVRGKRIVAVSESTVVLEGPAGRTVLRLPPAPQSTP